MNKIFTNTIIAIGLIAASTAASAEGWYFGANVAFLDYEQDDGTVGGVSFSADKGDVESVYVRLGNRFHENLSVELRGGTGLSDDTIDVTITAGGSGTIEVDLEVEWLYGVYARAGLPLGSFYPYLLGGFTHVELKAEAGNIEIDDSDSDFSYGAGADWKIHEGSNGNSTSLNFEYLQAYDKSGVEVDGFAVGLSYTF